MKMFYSEPKELMPGVILDRDSGKFRMFGISCPMEPFEFFDPILEWFHEYMKDPLDETVLEIRFSYFDTSTSKFLLHILYILEDLRDSGYSTKVRWYYGEEDIDMYEEAEEFESVTDIEFEMIAVEKELEDFQDDEFFEKIMETVM